MVSVWVSSGSRNMSQNCVPHSALYSGLPQTCMALNTTWNLRGAALHVPAASPSSSAQEKTTTLGGIEPHHSSSYCKKSHRCCCHGSLAPLEMGISGIFTAITRYESMRLRSLRQNERTTGRDLVQYKRWTYPRYRAVNTKHQQRWTRWWCTTPSKHLAKVISKRRGDYI